MFKITPIKIVYIDLLEGKSSFNCFNLKNNSCFDKYFLWCGGQIGHPGIVRECPRNYGTWRQPAVSMYKADVKYYVWVYWNHKHTHTHTEYTTHMRMSYMLQVHVHIHVWSTHQQTCPLPILIQLYSHRLSFPHYGSLETKTTDCHLHAGYRQMTIYSK